MSVEIESGSGSLIMAERWPLIGRYLDGPPTGWVSARFHWWDWWNRDRLGPADLAAAYEEWADFYQWRLAQRADELATDPSLRRILERDTDDLVYLFHWCAAHARGEDPGPWLHSWERRSTVAHDYADADGWGPVRSFQVVRT